MNSRSKHLIKHYIVRPVFLLLSLLFIITTVLYSTSNLFDDFKYNFILRSTSSPMSDKLNDYVPENTDRIYFDIEKNDWSKYEFNLTTKNGREIKFNETPYGATSILTSQDFGALIDVNILTYAKGVVNFRVTFIDHNGSEISSSIETKHFDRSMILEIVMYILIIISLLFLIFSFKIKHIIEFIKRNSQKSKLNGVPNAKHKLD